MPLPQLPSLNRKDVLDKSARSQLMPYELTGNHTLVVLGFKFNPASKENRNQANFKAKIEIIDSDNKNAIGRSYQFWFPINGDPDSQDYRDRDRRAFIAACMGQHSEDPDFDADAAQQTLVDMDEAGDFDSRECVILHTRTSKTKEKAEKKNGQAVLVEKVYANDFFSPRPSA